MSFIHGKSGYVAIGTASSETDISAKCDSCDLSLKVDKAETSTFVAAGAAANKTYLAGFIDNAIKIGGKWDSTVDGILAALVGVDGKSLVHGPANNTTGNVKYSALGFIAGYDVQTKQNGAVTWTAEFQVTGAVTRGTF